MKINNIFKNKYSNNHNFQTIILLWHLTNKSKKLWTSSETSGKTISKQSRARPCSTSSWQNIELYSWETLIQISIPWIQTNMMKNWKRHGMNSNLFTTRRFYRLLPTRTYLCKIFSKLFSKRSKKIPKFHSLPRHFAASVTSNFSVKSHLLTSTRRLRRLKHENVLEKCGD